MGPLLAQLTFVSCEDELGRHIYTYCNLLHYQSFNTYCWMMKQWTFNSRSQRIRTSVDILICLMSEIHHCSCLHSYQYHHPQIDYSLLHSCQCPRYHARHLPKEQSNVYYLYCAEYIA
eukprot:213797_1